MNPTARKQMETFLYGIGIGGTEEWTNDELIETYARAKAHPWFQYLTQDFDFDESEAEKVLASRT